MKNEINLQKIVKEKFYPIEPESIRITPKYRKLLQVGYHFKNLSWTYCFNKNAAKQAIAPVRSLVNIIDI